MNNLTFIFAQFGLIFHFIKSLIYNFLMFSCSNDFSAQNQCQIQIPFLIQCLSEQKIPNLAETSQIDPKIKLGKSKKEKISLKKHAYSLNQRKESEGGILQKPLQQNSSLNRLFLRHQKHSSQLQNKTNCTECETQNTTQRPSKQSANFIQKFQSGLLEKTHSARHAFHPQIKYNAFSNNYPNQNNTNQGTWMRKEHKQFYFADLENQKIKGQQESFQMSANYSGKEKSLESVQSIPGLQQVQNQFNIQESFSQKSLYENIFRTVYVKSICLESDLDKSQNKGGKKNSKPMSNLSVSERESFSFKKFKKLRFSRCQQLSESDKKQTGKCSKSQSEFGSENPQIGIRILESPIERFFYQNCQMKELRRTVSLYPSEESVSDQSFIINWQQSYVRVL